MLVKQIGEVEVSYHASDDPVVSFLVNQGVLFGEGNFKLLDQFIKQKGRIIDCGSHIGTFSIPAVLAGYKVTAIDGAPKNVECLKETAKQFNDNLDVFEEILSDTVAKCSFSHDSGPFGWILEDPENGNFMSQTLDNLCEAHNYDNICAIKYDVEGGEIGALEGSKGVLATHKPPLLIEVNGWCLYNKQKSPKDLFATIESLEYTIYLPFSNTLFIIDKDKNFPFCVTDVIAIHNDCLDQYPFLDNARVFTDEEIELLIAQNYQNSNGDCKCYFDSIQDKESVA
jgi:FkbM family methyltransferase|tara:strand:- start:13078 stop:13929 length:852 start_codon:yes stop_codon:yes gene_type:complete